MLYNYYRKFSRGYSKVLTSKRELELDRKLIMELKQWKKYNKIYGIGYRYYVSDYSNKRPKVIEYGKRFLYRKNNNS